MNSKIKCILLDDELPGLTYLKMLCEQIPELEVVKAFNDPVVFLAESTYLEFDLAIMDIEMPGMNGLNVAQLLKGKPVVFTTAYKEFAAEAFDIEAVDYITKPIMKERLQKAVFKVKRFLEPSPKEPVNTFLTVNSNRGKTLLHFDTILYIKTSESDSRDKEVFLTDHNSLIIKNISLDKLLTDLPDKQFCRINKREIIALKIVQYFSYDEITTTILTKSNKPLVLTLGNSFRNEFLRSI